MGLRVEREDDRIRLTSTISDERLRNALNTPGLPEQFYEDLRRGLELEK